MYMVEINIQTTRNDDPLGVRHTLAIWGIERRGPMVKALDARKLMCSAKTVQKTTIRIGVAIAVRSDHLIIWPTWRELGVEVAHDDRHASARKSCKNARQPLQDPVIGLISVR